MSTKPARKKAAEVICSGVLTEADLRRYAVFDENDRYVGIKPGIKSDDINPNWRRAALAWSHTFTAIQISRAERKADRARRIAEAIAISLVGGVFAKPHYESTDKGERLFFGEFWYLTAEERDESARQYLDSFRNPNWPDTLEAVRGIEHGLTVIEMLACGMRSLEDPAKIHFIRKASIELITEWDTYLEDPALREALEAVITSDRFSRKSKLTTDLAAQATTLYAERHKRLQAAKLDYTRHKGSPAWPKHVEIDDKKRPGKPKIPLVHIRKLSDPEKSPRMIALEWTSEELNRRDPGLAATANTVRRLMEAAHKADSHTIQHDEIG